MQAEADNVFAALTTGQGLENAPGKDRERLAAFGEDELTKEDADGADALKQRALINLRDRRMRLKSSTIFNA